MADSIVSADIGSLASKQFSYPSLDNKQREIRVLELLAGDYDDPIVCSLRFELLDEAPAYEALSYVWGDPNVTANISINEQIFAITTNLEAFLRRIRLPNRNRSLWVDALCINQQDNSEKAHQVHLMGSIYKNCQQGLIWLGELATHDVTASEARALFDYIEYVALRKSLAKSDLVEPKLSKIFVTMEAMMKSQWWQRIWTIQEALLPPSATVIWGSESCLWGTIEGAGLQFVIPERYNDPHNPLPPFNNSMSQILNNFFLYHVSAMRRTREGENPLKTLRRFRGRHATDPRDKVFGLLGLFPKALSFEGYATETGYNLSVGAVFARTTLGLVKGSGGLRPLVGLNSGAPQVHPKATLGAPSWAVDWVDWDDGVYMVRWWDHYVNYPIYNCANDTALSFSYHEEDLSLSFDGLHVDTITKVINIHDIVKEGSPNPAHAILALKSEVESLFDFVSRYISGCTWRDAFWRTMIGDLLPIGEYSEFWAGPEDVDTVERGCMDQVPDRKLCEGTTTQLDFHTMFITRSGYLGIGSMYTSVDDEVFVLLGGRIPFVLRPDARGRRHYTMVGDCYTHGIMKGEALTRTELEAELVTVTLH